MGQLTVTVGSDPIALVQSGAINGATGTQYSATLPNPSTPGTALIAVVVIWGLSGSPAVRSVPGTWKFLDSSLFAANFQDIEVWCLPNNPGGIQTATFTGDAGSPSYMHLSEWANVDFQASVDTKGEVTSTSGTTLTPRTSSGVASSGALAISAWFQVLAAPAIVTFTSPTGFTRLADNGAGNGLPHVDIEYQIGPVAAGPPLAPVLTSNQTTSGATGVTVVLKPASPVTDVTGFVAYESASQKLNTFDFALNNGGRLLQEDGGSGLLLEDGSGYLLVDAYTPQLGDPVVSAKPTWSGRVVSVQQDEITERTVNYQRVTVSATNTAAPPGGTSPGDFSDTASSAHFTLEDGSGSLLMEDGSGFLLQENATFGYQHLSIKTSQNQDGTSTVYGTLEMFEAGFAAGQTFRLYNANLGINGTTYTIQNVTVSFFGQGTPVFVVEFGDSYQTLQEAGGGVLTQQASTASTQYGVVTPAGVLGYAQVTTTQGTYTALTDITGLTVTVTVGSGRRIRITGYVPQGSSVATDLLRSFIRENGTTLQFNDASPNSTGGNNAGQLIWIGTPSAGTHTYNLSGQRVVGTGNVTMEADPTSPAFILVEDIGA